jgi:hypothetical protein
MHHRARSPATSSWAALGLALDAAGVEKNYIPRSNLRWTERSQCFTQMGRCLQRHGHQYSFSFNIGSDPPAVLPRYYTTYMSGQFKTTNHKLGARPVRLCLPYMCHVSLRAMTYNVVAGHIVGRLLYLCCPHYTWTRLDFSSMICVICSK